jgi:hypothetical protein
MTRQQRTSVGRCLMAQSLHSCSSRKPQLFADVQLYFAASPETVGYWTGHDWIVMGCVVQPVSWSAVYPDSDLDPKKS